MRAMIEIDEELCDGCGLCVPSCHEGAIQIINGKARLVSDSMCDGLGACLGHCPQGALKVTQREADPFVDPLAAEATHGGEPGSGGAHGPGAAPHVRPTSPVVAPSPASPTPHPVHADHHHAGGGCPGSRMRVLTPAASRPESSGPGAPVRIDEPSRLAHWPVQIRLVPPQAPFLHDAKLVVAADCVPVALPGFHRDFVDDHTIMIGCPKFDDLEMYSQRFQAIFETAQVRNVTVVVMEVPCCRSLPTAVLQGMDAANATVPCEVVVVGVDGEIRQRVMVREGAGQAN
jgi:NAD-dependent dihydropyrimidine dehydrogenase PreA subunit